MNSGMGAIMCAICGIFILIYASDVRALNGIMGINLAVTMVSAGCFFSSTMVITAPSISLEGKNLWLIRSMPIEPKKILYAKLLVHEIYTSPALLFFAIAVTVIFKTSFVFLIGAILMTQVFNFMLGIFGLLINLRFPRLDYISEVQVIKQSASVGISMLCGMGFSLLVIILSMISSFIMPSALFLFIMTAILGAVSFVLFKALERWGTRAFEAL
jgi:ABC-2 type transport system permease protein